MFTVDLVKQQKYTLVTNFLSLTHFGLIPKISPEPSNPSVVVIVVIDWIEDQYVRERKETVKDGYM